MITKVVNIALGATWLTLAVVLFAVILPVSLILRVTCTDEQLRKLGV